jgi:hypothetical protein
VNIDDNSVKSVTQYYSSYPAPNQLCLSSANCADNDDEPTVVASNCTASDLHHANAMCIDPTHAIADTGATSIFVMAGSPASNATRGDITTSRVKHEGGTMRGNIQPADALRGGVATRGDATTSRDEQDGGAMRGEVALRRRVERWWRRQGDATTSWGKREGGASRGHVTTSRHVETVARREVK